MSKLSAINRTLIIIKYLNEGKKITLENLAMEFDVSDRTIRRDFNVIEQVLGTDFIKKENNLYFAVEKNLLSDILKGTNLATFLHILTFFKEGGIKLDLDKNIEKLLKENKKVYELKNKPFEYIKNSKIIADLEYAIKHKHEIKIKYITQKNILNKKLKPYKITMLNENFYLLSMEEKGDFVFSRINMIEEVEVLSKTFYHDQEVLNFIKTIQTPMARFNAKNIEIELEANANVAKHFKNKKFFDSQIIKEEKCDGSLIVSYTVTCYEELEDFVIRWLPGVKINHPKRFKAYINKILNEKLLSLM